MGEHLQTGRLRILEALVWMPPERRRAGSTDIQGRITNEWDVNGNLHRALQSGVEPVPAIA